MKNLKSVFATLLLTVITLLSSSCKKDKSTSLEPICQTASINNNSVMRIQISNTGSTASSKLEGKIWAMNGIDTLFVKELSHLYIGSFDLDTTINVNSSHIEIKIFTISMKNIGGNNFDYDNIADGNVKVSLDNDIKINAYGSNIVVESKIK